MEEGLIRLPPLQDIVIQVDDLLVAVHQTVAESWERVDNPGHPGGDPKLGVDFTGDGSFVVEQIFHIPGIGRNFVDSILSRDYPLLMASVLLYAAAVAIANLLVDISYGFLDPRIRY